MLDVRDVRQDRQIRVRHRLRRGWERQERHHRRTHQEWDLYSPLEAA